MRPSTSGVSTPNRNYCDPVESSKTAKRIQIEIVSPKTLKQHVPAGGTSFSEIIDWVITLFLNEKERYSFTANRENCKTLSPDENKVSERYAHTFKSRTSSRHAFVAEEMNLKEHGL
jgi:hypothetical protein